MKKLKTLLVSFENPIAYSELPAFRAGIIEKAGRNHVIFHNHLDSKRYVYRYPRIQYKIINQQPAIVCVDEGVDEIHHFFQNRSWDFNLYDRPYSVKIERLNINQFNMQVWETRFTYNLIRWNALNQENYKKFKELGTETERINLLDSILTGNIISFAKGIDWTLEKEVKVSISKINRQRWLPLKGQKVLSFDIEFTTNVFLPNYIGLGKNVSLGFGIVRQKKYTKTDEQ
jgi:hypothetical protein